MKEAREQPDVLEERANYLKKLRDRGGREVGDMGKNPSK